MACAICLDFMPEKFTADVGNPPTTLTDLFYQCTETECDCDEGVCTECHNHLSRYHEAMQIVRDIKRHFLEVLQYCNARQAELEYEEIIEMEEFEVVEEEEDDDDEDNTQPDESAPEDDIKYEVTSLDGEVDEIDVEDGQFQFACGEDVLSISEIATANRKMKRPKAADEVYPRKCEECDETLRSKHSYDVHLKNHHFKGFVCEFCGKTLMSRTGFLTHQENHLGDTFVCNECGQSFKNKCRLKHHMAWHSGQKPFQCEICDKRFVHNIGLYRHKRIHQDETRCIPCEECGFKFRTNSHLRRHMLSHTGAKPYTCMICGKGFSQSYNLKVHVKEHENPGSTKQRRFKCKKCSRSFRNKENYDEHCLANDCEAPAERK